MELSQEAMRRGKCYPGQVYLWSAAITMLVSIDPAFTGTAPPTNSIAGDWTIDATVSDNFTAKLEELVKAQRKRSRPRQPSATNPAERAISFPEEVPPISDDRMRSRLTDSLRPASELKILLNGTTVELVADNEPSRRLTPGQVVSRMDADGTAKVSAIWSGSVLTVRSVYTHRARRLQQFSTDRNGRLRVLLQVFDPVMGKIELHSYYARKPGN